MTTGLLALAWTPAEPSPQTGKVAPAALFDLADARQWMALQNQLQTFARYSRNWDGLDSPPPIPHALQLASEYLKIVRAEEGITPSHVSLAPDGTVLIEWWFGERVLQAAFGDGDKIDWVDFRPNVKPTHWPEILRAGGNARGEIWDSTTLQEEGSADYSPAS